jgi:hypothetical protein
MTSDSGRDGGRLSRPTNANIVQKSQNSPESSHRAGKSLVGMLRS